MNSDLLLFRWEYIFLGLESAKKFDAASLLIYIKQKLAICGVDLNYCLAQIFDGAAVMSGSCAGVQALLSFTSHLHTLYEP